MEQAEETLRGAHCTLQLRIPGAKCRMEAGRLETGGQEAGGQEAGGHAACAVPNLSVRGGAGPCCTQAACGVGGGQRMRCGWGAAHVVESCPAWKPRKTVYSRKELMSP